MRQETHVETEARHQIKDFRKDSVNEKEFAEHCLDNKKQFNNTDKKLERLMPLTELIPTLRKIVEDENAKRWLAKRIVSFLKISGIIIGSTIAIFWVIWEVIKEMRK